MLRVVVFGPYYMWSSWLLFDPIVRVHHTHNPSNIILVFIFVSFYLSIYLHTRVDQIMPKLPSLVTGVFVVPVLIAAITILQLNDILDTWTTAFFGYTTSQQMAVLGLIFSVIFGCLAIAAAASAPFPSSRSSVIGSSSSAVSQVTAKIRYPLDAIAAADSDKEKFKALYPSLRDEILECIKTENELLPEAVDWVREMMEYSVPGGKLNRGTTVIDVYRTLLGRPLTHLEVARAAVAGWCIEFLQAFFLVADDVMDGSPTRRGQPCWYKVRVCLLAAAGQS